MTDDISLRDILELNQEIDRKLDLMANRITVIEVWQGEMKGRFAIIVAVFSFGVTVAYEFIKDRIHKGL